MDAQDGSTDTARVEASRLCESKVVAGARVRSIDYEAIIEDTVAGFVGTTRDERRKIYALARSVVWHRLWLLQLPEPIVEREKLALDFAIGKIERRWGTQDAAEKLAAEERAAEYAVPFNVPAPPIKRPATAIVSIAGMLSGRLVSPVGVAVALPVIAATIFFGLDMHHNVAFRGAVGGLFERWFPHPGGEPGVTGRVADVRAGRGSARDAPGLAAHAPAAGPRASAPSPPSPASGGGRAACGRGSSTSERACLPDVSSRDLAAETPKTENEPLWLESFTAFSDMTWGSEPVNALNGPTAAAEDFAVGGGMPYVAPAADAAPMSADAEPRAAAPQAPRPPAKPINAKIVALIANGNQAALKGDLDRATRDFSEAIRIDPKYPDTYLERGQAFFKLGETERAIADYSAALARDPQHGAALRARGMAHLYLGKTDLALADLTKAIELGEHDPQMLAPIELFYARRSRGSIYESQQQYDQAIADCTALIESYAHDPMLVEALAANYGNAGAANILARVYRQRAGAFARRSSVERAVADLTQAIPLSSDRGYAALIDRSKLHEGLGRRDLAAADARAALNIRPGSEEARLALSRLSALSSPAPPKGL
jgi:tetratricopeptide (TPR) repeat protein